MDEKVRNELVNYTKQVIKNSSEYLDDVTIKSKYQRVCAFYYYRGLSLLKAMHMLTRFGPPIESGLLLRSIFNLRVTLHWILSEEEGKNERICRYYDFIQPYRFRLFENYPDLIKSDDFDKLKKDSKEIWDKYNCTRRREKYNWAGVSIYKMSKDVGCVDDYEKVYTTNSDLEHTNSIVEHFFMEYNEEGKIISNGSNPFQLIATTLLLTINYFLVIKHLSAYQFYLNEKEIEKEIDKCLAQQKKYL